MDEELCWRKKEVETLSFKDFLEGVKDVGPKDEEGPEACDDMIDAFYPKKCTYCGSKFPEKARFCIECGRALYNAK